MASRKQSIFTHFPKDRSCEVWLPNQEDKGSLQKTHWRSSTSSRKVWWLDNGWSQGPQRGGWIMEQSPVRCRGTRSCDSTDSIFSVQNKDFSGDGREFAKVSPTVTQAKGYLYRQFVEFGASCEDLSWNHRTSIRDNWHCWKSRTKSDRRNFSSIATIRIWWKLVGWFYGMLLPSAKCSRTPGRWENSPWKTMWRTIQRTNTSFWSDGCISSDFNTRSIKTSSIETFTRNLVCIVPEGNLKRIHHDCGCRWIGKDGRIRN